MEGRKKKENRKEEKNGKEKRRNANNLILGIRLDKASLFLSGGSAFILKNITSFMNYFGKV